MSCVDVQIHSQHPAARCATRSGMFWSKKMGRVIPYTNLLVLNAILLLEADPDVTFYAAITTPFIWSMGLKQYQRDIALQYTHNTRGRILLDVRRGPNDNANRLNRQQGRSDAQIEKRANALGYSSFEVWNKATIHAGHRLKNAALIVRHQALDPSDDHVAVLHFVMRCANGSLPLKQICSATNLGTRAEPAIFHFLANGGLVLVEPDRKLDGASLISLGVERPWRLNKVGAAASWQQGSVRTQTRGFPHSPHLKLVSNL